MFSMGCARSAGFTLIELLVALGILAFGLVTVLQAFNTSLGALRHSQAAIRASALMNALVNEAAADPAFAAGTGARGRELEAIFADFDWTVGRRPGALPAGCTNATFGVDEIHAAVTHRLTGYRLDIATRILTPKEPADDAR